MKELKYLQRLFLLLAVGFSLSFACVACGDDEDDEPFDDPNTEQNDNGGGGSQNGGTAPTDSIMPPAEEPVLPNDSTSGGEDSPIVSDSIKNEYHEAVDLGLSVKWATCNVGASFPEEYGDYFAWGETTTKSNYVSDNCFARGFSVSELQSRGIIDSDGNLTAAYDAATANWGGSWRMPTINEIRELRDKCTWKKITYNGMSGRLVSGPNGNSIFLPAAGGRGGTAFNEGSNGYYRSATPDDEDNYVHGLRFGTDDYFNTDYCYTVHDNRYYGYSVRPVTD